MKSDAVPVHVPLTVPSHLQVCYANWFLPPREFFYFLSLDFPSSHPFHSLQLFFARTGDNALLLLAAAAAIIAGLGSPTYYLILGKMVDLFLDFSVNARGNSSSRAQLDAAFHGAVFSSARWFFAAAAVLFVASALQMALWESTALKRACELRVRLFRAVLQQEVSWHDQQSGGEILTRLSDDVSFENCAEFLIYRPEFFLYKKINGIIIRQT